MNEKDSRLPVSVIVLTFNEEKHILRCLSSVKNIASEMFVVDCDSSDKTKDIAESSGAMVVKRSWPGNQAAQMNWALENLPIRTEWVMRLDADEYLTDKLAAEIRSRLPEMTDRTSGIYFNRRVYFMGRWIRHGGYYPISLLRLWRNSKAVCEQRWMDEHMVILEGTSAEFDNDIVDDNLNDLTWWTEKHNSYASREAVELLALRHRLMVSTGIDTMRGASQEKTKRRLKENYYARLPLFIRAFIYWNYRYLLKLGLLDGPEGFIFHFLQGLWYRFLVDAKIYQVERYADRNKTGIRDAVREVLGIEV